MRDKRKLDARVYENTGNDAVLEALDADSKRILDVGCGAGDNAREINRLLSKVEVYGITLSPSERRKAICHMEECWIADIEKGIPEEVSDLVFDTIIFSHVLEHIDA